MKTNYEYEIDMSNWLPCLPFRSNRIYLLLECNWSIEDVSFDYAGTHCTGGRSGTYYSNDTILDSVTITEASCVEYGKTILLTSQEQETYTSIATNRITKDYMSHPTVNEYEDYHSNY
jgi:hypothetical protein